MSGKSSFSRYFWQGTIERVSDKGIDNTKNRVYLVMGPIGAGKSRFIESLAGNDDLQISRDQLDSFTRGITAYELINTETPWYGPVNGVFIRPPSEPGTIIIDTPGFSDNQISEVEIIQMVNKWLNAHNCEKIHGILYLCPITDTRLSGSKRRTIQMLKLLAGINTETQGAIIVVTTMWDRLWMLRL
ncbi:hypothetical protein BJ165DRAFT_263661 [Panaeolus papilionaceus]|nr:hypothetical protein BJ165DRAFT_263661 [Panaeolus papilionaceus]